QWFQNKKKIGGTKSVKYELVKELKPDLIIANKEENLREQVLPLYNIAPVYTSHISTLEEALTMIEQVGALTSKGAAAQKIIQTIQQDFSKLVSISYQPRTAYLIWRDPYMSVGNDTFIH
ncbi:helical backbone metal receptor, partial [Klebsiella pneumoniae]|uniref:helical backbone metal receptor n=1 Tax=Klebsiella pneumoniae TaxID=573 RepID=UPI0022322D1E